MRKELLSISLIVMLAVPGTLSVVPTININNAPNVKNIRLRKSLLVGANICFKLANITTSPRTYFLTFLFY